MKKIMKALLIFVLFLSSAALFAKDSISDTPCNEFDSVFIDSGGNKFVCGGLGNWVKSEIESTDVTEIACDDVGSSFIRKTGQKFICSKNKLWEKTKSSIK